MSNQKKHGGHAHHGKSDTSYDMWIKDNAIASSISPIVFIDTSQIVTYVNKAFMSIWRYSDCEQVVGKDAGLFWHIDKQHGRFLRKLNDKGGWIGEITALRHDGSEFPAQMSATILTDRAGKPACMMASFIDISEKVNARNEQKLLFEQLRERVKELDCLYKILSIPRGAEQSLAEVLEQIAEALPASLRWPEIAYTRIVLGALDVRSRRYKPSSAAITFPLNLRPDGGYIEIGYNETDPRCARPGTCFLAEEAALFKAATQEIQTILAQKNAEDKARLNHERLLHADKMASIGVLSSEIIHEISNPNNYVAMNARMLGKMWESMLPILDAYYRENGDYALAGIPFSEARREVGRLIDGILDGSGRIKEISTRLRSFARTPHTTAGREFRVNESVEKAIEFTRRLIQKSTEHFVFKLNPGQPIATGNAWEIQQVIINLLTNACQALPSREKSIVITTDVSKDGEYVSIKIIDKGIGIAPQDISRVRDPFYSTKHESGGTGLGLSISEEIAIRHGGKLHITSRKDEGTTAEVVLPRRMPHEEAPA